MSEVNKLFEGWRRFRQNHYTVGSDPFYGPPPLINDVVDCWANEGIRFFTELHHANGMAYNVMLPIEELEFHIERPVGGHNLTYLTQQLIEQGNPMHAVRIVVGKNGRAIIDRDAEIVAAAKQVGLAKLPVLFVFEDEV